MIIEYIITLMLACVGVVVLGPPLAAIYIVSKMLADEGDGIRITISLDREDEE